MRWYHQDDDYQARQLLRAAFGNWLAEIDADFFVTLAFAQDTELNSAQTASPLVRAHRQSLFRAGMVAYPVTPADLRYRVSGKYPH